VKARWIVGPTISAALSLLTLSARAADITACTKQQLLGFTAKRDEIKTHRQFPLPFISYPFGNEAARVGHQFSRPD
jgi:hypothetical protein